MMDVKVLKIDMRQKMTGDGLMAGTTEKYEGEQMKIQS